MRQRFIRITEVLLVGLASGFLGALFGAQGGLTSLFGLHSTVMSPDTVNLAPVWEAWRVLEEKYVPATTTTPLADHERVWGMIEGLANAYGDPYTVFMPPEQAAAFQADIRGSFGGVGIEIGIRTGVLTVIAPLKGTPADMADVRTGDVILEIDGVSTALLSIDEAIARIRGEVGTVVTLTIAREDMYEFITVPLTRARIQVPTIEHALRDDGVYLISLYNFGATAADDMRTALRSFIQSGSDRLLIDLRGNPGGYLNAAVDIASWFLPLGAVVVTEDYGGRIAETVHRSTGHTVYEPHWEVAVLVDEGSASASEILAGALQEHGVATLLGERTFGKGSVQELVELLDDALLKVTVARWLTPQGVSISNGGLTPDIMLERPTERASTSDPWLAAAALYLTTGTTTPE